MREFLLHLFLYQPVAPVHHLDDKAGVIVDRVEIAAAPQHQGLVDGILETEVRLLGDFGYNPSSLRDRSLRLWPRPRIR